MLMIHVCLSVLSIFAGLLATWRPGSNVLLVQALSFMLSMLTGFLLVLDGSGLKQFCVSGIAFSFITLALRFVARRKLLVLES